jgi:hypothetical protein
MTTANAAALPRGLRNCNPGNIRHGQPWQGRAAVQDDPDFVTFKSYAWGVRAMARVLITYQDTHQLGTVRAIIGRWAPPTENDTEAYVRSVAGRIGVDPDEPVNVHDYAVMRVLVEAITLHENGRVAPITPADFDQGLAFAGVVPERKRPLLLTREGGGGAIATAATATGAVVDQLKDHDVHQAVQQVAQQAPALETATEAVQEAREAVSYTLGIWEWAGIALAVLALAGVGLALYGRWDRRRRGIV